MNKQAITINPEDNVGVALVDLKRGDQVIVNEKSITLLHDIPAKHKFAISSLPEGGEVRMYDVLVGKTKSAVQAGMAITTQNTFHQSGSFDVALKKEFHWNPPDVSRWRARTFMGYHRADGQVGTANFWLVFPLVFCENRNVEALRKAFEKGLGYQQEDNYSVLVRYLVDQYKNNNLDETIPPTILEKQAQAGSKPRIFENIDGVQFLTHQGGCGGTRQDAETLCRLLAGYVNNPNVAGATVLSLGCQNAEVDLFKQSLQRMNPEFNKPVLIFDQQNSGTEREMISTAIKDTFLHLVKANQQTRKPAPLSKLTIGLECGGSDGFSGISANPSIGHTSDLVVALGGKAILSEFPELCGVEQELINRSKSREIAEKFSRLMSAYEKAAVASGSGFDMNPSPGNIKDGLITDAMKSAGAAKKGGTSPVADVLDYAEYVRQAGLNLLCTPGNDVESTTGLAASGATIILFTTGLGTPTGNPITPVIKLSSNTRLAERMPDIIDINTGSVISGDKTIEEMGEEVLEFVIAVASGERSTKATLLHQHDFIPWKRGVSL